jgi:hypothetical protein
VPILDDMGAQSSFGFHLATLETPRPEVVLAAGEEVVAEGTVWAGWGRRRPLGVLVVTNRRLLLHTHRLFGKDQVVEVAAEAVVAVSPPDAGDVVDVRYLAPGGAQATVHLAPVRWAPAELYRALAGLVPTGS